MKVKRSITVDKKVNDFFVKDPSINASALCNKLLTTYFKEKTENQKQ